MPNLEDAKRPRVPYGELTLRIAAALAVLAVLVEVVLPAVFSQRSIHLATSVQSEPVTELYFVDHLRLPKTMPAGHTTQVTYHIQNGQGTDLIYYPRVTLFENGAAHRIPQRALPISNGQGMDVVLAIQPTSPGENLELVIDLPGQGESIHIRSQS